MENKNIAYFGPKATFTHEAALKYFHKNNNFIPVDRIEDVFRKVINDDADFGVVPAENSIAGTIVDTIDLFVQTKLKIYDQISIEIIQNLLSKTTKEKIKKIYSHPHSIHQCSKYLLDNFPNIEYIESTSNSKAAILVCKDPDSASIGPILCAAEYGLNVIEKNINDFKHNETKFFIISKNFVDQLKKKSMIIFSVPNVPGSLFHALKIFKKTKINMTRIESRPSKLKKWDYVFIIEYENSEIKSRNEKMLKLMQKHCDYFNYLGSY
ncbi:MAG: prephenate dehydratase [Spirochaetes bacterium]|nr:prephenate dehydratase [Spirochaetota bacterium]